MYIRMYPRSIAIRFCYNVLRLLYYNIVIPSPELIRIVNTTNNKTVIFTPSTQGKICTITLHGISNIFVHFASRAASLGSRILTSVWAWFRNPSLHHVHACTPVLVLIIQAKGLATLVSLHEQAQPKLKNLVNISS